MSRLPLAGDWVRQPKFLHSGMSQAAFLPRSLLSFGGRSGCARIADRLSQHLAQLRLCLCRFSFGWLPLSHAPCVGMLGEIKPFSSRQLAVAQQGSACRQYRHVLRRLSLISAVVERHADRKERAGSRFLLAQLTDHFREAWDRIGRGDRVC